MPLICGGSGIIGLFVDCYRSCSPAGILFSMKIGNLMLASVDPMVSVMQFLQMNVLFVIIAISLWLFNDLLLSRRAQ